MVAPVEQRDETERTQNRLTTKAPYKGVLACRGWGGGQFSTAAFGGCHGVEERLTEQGLSGKDDEKLYIEPPRQASPQVVGLLGDVEECGCGSGCNDRAK
jgi:hypothetical protein